jgi:hypothetical protein
MTTRDSNTSKAKATKSVRRKRPTRQVETDKFDAFARRILRAYGRRVAAGDIEALTSLVDLSAEIDAVTRLAVTGLHNKPYSYSWSEIADRLGTSRQAAQMRYGDKTDRGGLDPRITRHGMAVTVATLAQVYADHHPATPTPSKCPGCGFTYPTDGPTACPTLAVVRPLLYRRRAEDKHAVARLTPDQLADLHTTRGTRAGRQAARPAPTPPAVVPTLFDLHAKEATR